MGDLPYAPHCLFDVALFGVMPDLKLLPLFTARCRLMFGLRWPSPLQLAALQRGLRFNVGSCDYSGRVWKGNTSFIVR